MSRPRRNQDTECFNRDRIDDGQYVVKTPRSKLGKRGVSAGMHIKLPKILSFSEMKLHLANLMVV